MQQNDRKRSGIWIHTHDKTISASGLEPSSFIIVYIAPLLHIGLRFRNSQPQSFATWALSPPARSSLMVLISATLCVWTRSPWSTRPHPRETAVVMVTQPITVAQGGAAGKIWARRDPSPQMAVSEYRQGQIEPLLLQLATDLDPDLHATSWGFGGTCRSEATSWFCSTVTEYSLQH